MASLLILKKLTRHPYSVRFVFTRHFVAVDFILLQLCTYYMYVYLSLDLGIYIYVQLGFRHLYILVLLVLVGCKMGDMAIATIF